MSGTVVGRVPVRLRVRDEQRVPERLDGLQAANLCLHRCHLRDLRQRSDLPRDLSGHLSNLQHLWQHGAHLWQHVRQYLRGDVRQHLRGNLCRNLWHHLSHMRQHLPSDLQRRVCETLLRCPTFAQTHCNTCRCF